MPNDAASARAVTGIVLAAGASTRMGQNKLLLEIDGEPIVRRSVRRAIAANLSPVLVVIGFEAERVRHALRGLVYEAVLNPSYARGINASVRLGIGRVSREAAAAVVVLADMPFVTTAMLAALVAEYRRSRAPLVISDYEGVRAPPTLYDRKLFGEFTDDDGEGCGKRVVRRHAAAAAVVRWPAGALTDLDVPADVHRVGARDAVGHR